MMYISMLIPLIRLVPPQRPNGAKKYLLEIVAYVVNDTVSGSPKCVVCPFTMVEHKGTVATNGHSCYRMERTHNERGAELEKREADDNWEASFQS